MDKEKLKRDPIGHRLQGSKRLPNELFETYQKRRTFENELMENYLKGEIIKL